MSSGLLTHFFLHINFPYRCRIGDGQRLTKRDAPPAQATVSYKIIATEDNTEKVNLTYK